MTENPTACLLIIGNEVLSGRTRDANLQFIASRLGELGIPMREARIIPDVPETIISTLNEVRARHTHVFTTGGIGLRDGGPLAIIFSLVCIAVGAFMLLLDFDQADQAVKAGVPAKFAWYLAFGFMTTLVWLYIEILRLLSYFRGE